MWKTLCSSINRDKWYLLSIIVVGILLGVTSQWISLQDFNALLSCSLILLISVLDAWVIEIIPIGLCTGKKIRGSLVWKYLLLSALVLILEVIFPIPFMLILGEKASILYGIASGVLGSLFMLGLIYAVVYELGLWAGIKNICQRYKIMWMGIFLISWLLYKLLYFSDRWLQELLEIALEIVIIYSFSLWLKAKKQ